MTGSVAFLGTGLMGAPMCRNLAASGVRVRAWNRSVAKAQAIGFGVEVAATAADAANGATACIVMLSDGPTCRKLLLDDGVAARLAPGALLVVMSSIGHAEALELAKEAQATGWLGLMHLYLVAPLQRNRERCRSWQGGTMPILKLHVIYCSPWVALSISDRRVPGR